MNAITAPKSSAQNRLEGFALTAIFQGLPTFAAAALGLKLVGSQQIVNEPGGTLFFVVFASLFHALLTPWLASRFARVRDNTYEPLFYDADLSFADKVAKWREQPKASLQLVTLVMMLSLPAVAVLSVR